MQNPSAAPHTVLIVGAGRIAGLNETDPVRQKPCTHVGGFQGNAAFNVIGVVDVDPAKAKAFTKTFRLPNAFGSIGEAMAATHPDLVTIAVPYQFHAGIVAEICASAHAPKAIFCEKPLSNELGAAIAMKEMCDRRGVRLFVNNRRLLPFYETVKSLLRDTFDNETISATAWTSSGLLAVGVHMLDLLQYIFGRAEWVLARTETEFVSSLPFSNNFRPDEPRASGLIAFKNGPLVSFVNSALTSFTYFELEILCRRGKIRASDNGNRLEIWQPAEPGKSTLSYGLDKPTFVPVDNTPLFAAIADSLIDALDAPPTDSHPLSAVHAIDTLRLIDAFVRSGQKENKVFLTEARQ